MSRRVAVSVNPRIASLLESTADAVQRAVAQMSERRANGERFEAMELAITSLKFEIGRLSDRIGRIDGTITPAQIYHAPLTPPVRPGGVIERYPLRPEQADRNDLATKVARRRKAKRTRSRRRP